MRSIPAALRGVFAGAGSDGLNEPAVVDAILGLVVQRNTTVPNAPVRVAYLGTATYDLPTPRQRQTALLAKAGCTIDPIEVASSASSSPTVDARTAIYGVLGAADVVLVSGGNTLFAMRRWQQWGIDSALRAAMERGAVLCGGSAGAICWFDGGHSDSLDPDTFRTAMLKAAAAARDDDGEAKDEASAAPATEADRRPWNYARVSCLGFLPGLVCPHHDRTQSNGIPRSADFDAMLLRHRNEQGLCIDHWAALVIDGPTYRVLAVPNKPGSVGASDAAIPVPVPNQQGVPGIWVKRVEDGDAARNTPRIVTTLAATEGRLSDLLQEPNGLPIVDPLEADGLALNPV